MIPQSDPFKVPSVTEEDFEKGPEVWNLTTRVRERKEVWRGHRKVDSLQAGSLSTFQKVDCHCLHF